MDLMLSNHQLAKLNNMMESLTEAELIALNRLVVERIKLMRRAGKIVQMSNFAVGEKVSFQTSDGHRISGIIS